MRVTSPAHITLLDFFTVLIYLMDRNYRAPRYAISYIMQLHDDDDDDDDDDLINSLRKI